MELLCLSMVLMAVAGATGATSDGEENELGDGVWNYREGGRGPGSGPGPLHVHVHVHAGVTWFADRECLAAERVNVASVPSVTRVLDAWGKRIFTQVRSALHAQPSTLLPDYSR